MHIRIIIIFFLFVFSSNIIACRLWAVCTKTGYALSSLPESERSLVIEQLEAFFYQSSNMPNGWALLKYDSIPYYNNLSVYRSHIPAYNDSSVYWNQVLTMLDSGQNRIGIGHLRLASSGVNDIPNPHPWIFLKDSVTYSLIHNGTIDKSKLYNLITNYESDLSWINENNPNTFSDHLWNSSEGWSRVVDSELLLLYIMQKINDSENIFDGLRSALTILINSGVRASQANIIFSNGSDLYAFGGLNRLSIIENLNHIAIMTQPVNYDNDSNFVWSGLQDKEMIHISKEGVNRFPNFIQHSNQDELYIPLFLNLKAAFPNPFNGQLTIPFEINSDDEVSISIFSILGEKVFNTVLNQYQLDRGYIKWLPINNSNRVISSGAYIIRAETKIMSVSQKILFIK